MKKINYSFWVPLAIGIVIFIAGAVYWFAYLTNEKTATEIPATEPIRNINPTPEKTLAPIPPTKNISVPYTVQAPFAKWSIHEESCEEAAILMYSYFLQNKIMTDIDPAIADSELNKIRKWQLANWGPEKDLDLTTLGKLAEGYYGHRFTVTKNFTKDHVMQNITAGKPVLVPVMTHSLNNPHYGRDNTYHILLITGYDQAGVFTNDAGIREGKGWHYTWETLFAAIDAQTPKMKQGRDLLILSI